MRTRIKLDMFQLGFSTASKGEKTSVDLSYGLGFARDKTTTVNPFVILPNSPCTAGAYPYPDVINRQQDLNLTVTRQLRPGLVLGFTYRHEPYRLNDYIRSPASSGARHQLPPEACIAYRLS